MVCALLLLIACGKKENTGTRSKPPATTKATQSEPDAGNPSPPPPAAKASRVTKSASEAPVPSIDAAPKPFVLTEKQCKAVSARSYALMQRWKPKRLTKKQKQQVADYAAQMEGVSLTRCRQNVRAWYDCKMKAKKHFESEDCNMIGATDEDGDPP